MVKKCFVTAEVHGTRTNISVGLSKSKANSSAKKLRHDMKTSIPKYRFAKNIKVVCK